MAATGIRKAPTGIEGFDDITGGGLPAGRPTLVCGAAGCGKTLFASTFLVKGVRDFGEPGLFVSFEERPVDIINNVASLGFEVEQLITANRLSLEHILVDPAQLVEAGEYDLEALFLRLQWAIDSVGARRVVLDTIESLFSAFTNLAILRAEIRRLFDWLKERELTTVITAERGDGGLTRQGLEEYVSDCVLLLDNRIQNQIATRRLRIIKYRGTAHGSNEYPFLIDDEGLSVLPVTSLSLAHEVFDERISSGIPDLDAMLSGGGFHRGSSILVSGIAGSGKTSVAASFINATCTAGGKAIYFSFEESAAQAIRNMGSIGLDLGRWLEEGRLKFISTRPTFYSLEMHLAVMLREVTKFSPDLVVLDPITAFDVAGDALEIQSTLLRMVDALKCKGITAVFTHLQHASDEDTKTETGLSSLMDSWILLLNSIYNGELNRELYLLKSRGNSHSNQVREFVIAAEGIRLIEPYIGVEGALTGSARRALEAKARLAELARSAEAEHLRLKIQQRRRRTAAQIEALRAELEADELEIQRLLAADKSYRDQAAREEAEISKSRGVNQTKNAVE